MSTPFHEAAMMIECANGPKSLESARQFAARSDLTPEERFKFDVLMADRFAKLNAEAVGEQKPRWSSKPLGAE